MRLERHNNNNGGRGIGDLLRDLVEGSVTLLRDEVSLARLEVGARARKIGAATGFVAGGAVLALIGVLSLMVGLVLLAGDQWLPADRYWLAALVALVVTGIVAGVIAKRGMALVAPRQLAPEQTVETLKEDTEWLRRQLTSDATSS